MDNTDDANQENWGYITGLSVDALIQHLKWFLNAKIEEEFGSLELKKMANDIVTYWDLNKNLSDAKILSARIILNKF